MKWRLTLILIIAPNDTVAGLAHDKWTNSKILGVREKQNLIYIADNEQRLKKFCEKSIQMVQCRGGSQIYDMLIFQINEYGIVALISRLVTDIYALITWVIITGHILKHPIYSDNPCNISQTLSWISIKFLAQRKTNWCIHGFHGASSGDVITNHQFI